MAILESLLVALDKRRPRPAEALRKNPYLEGNFAPVGYEADTPALDVIAGAIPQTLRGTLYRMSPAPRFPPVNRGLYHWFDGDGMIDAFFIDGGRVHHKNRWVRTEKLQIEERAGRALFGGLRDLATSTSIEGFLGLGFSAIELLTLQALGALGRKPSMDVIARILRAMDRSNTSIQKMAGRLLTLVEGSGAHEIDPHTLETLGRFDFDGAIDLTKGGMLAHPKIEPTTGAIYTLGYWGDRGGLTYYVIGRDGKLRLKREFETTYAAMMHDFSVTATRAVFYHLPAVLHLEDVKDPNVIRWEPSRGARIGVVDRDSPSAPLRWYSIPPCYIFHPLNAYDEGNTVVLDVVKFARLPLFDLASDEAVQLIDESVPGNLTRLVLDLDTGKVTETKIDEAPCEFPTCDPRYAMRRHRYGWIGARVGETCGRGHLNAIGKVDYQTGQVRFRTLGKSSYTGEALFVPRSDDAPEGDGYLMSTIYHADEGVSDLLILDAQQIEAEPVAVIRTRQRVPFGFHGTWVPSEQTA